MWRNGEGVSAKDVILDCLRFWYDGVPEGAQFSVDWIGEDNIYHSVLYPCTEEAYEVVAEAFADREDLHVFSRVAVLPPTFVQEHPGSRGRESDTWGSTTIQCDLDPPHDMDPIDYAGWQRYKIDELTAYRPKPTRVEISGRGLHALWKVRWIDDWRTVKQIQKAVAYALGGDDTFDCARVLRVTGTYNSKREALIRTYCLWDDSKLRDHHPYDVWELPSTELDRADDRLEAAQVDVAELTRDRVHELEMSDLWPRIQSEESAMDAGAHPKHSDPNRVSRHRNDIYVAVRLLRRGWTQEEVAAVLTHPEWFTGDKFRTKPNSYNLRYVWLTLAQAQAFVDKGTTDVVQMGNRIADALDGTYFRIYSHQLLVYTDRGVYAPGDTDFALAIQSYAGEKWRPDMVHAVRSWVEPHIKLTVPPEIPGMINTGTGFLEWGHDPPVLHKHAPGRFSISQVEARWNPNVRTNAVDAMVARLLYPDDIPVWWEWCGYCLSTELPIPFHKMLAIVGPPRTGKSTLLRALVEFLGPWNCSGVPLTELTGGGGQFTTSFLWGKMLNVDGDADYTRKSSNVSLLKRVSGGDMVKVERKGQQPTDEYLGTKLAFAMNGYPQIGSTDEAFYMRWLVLPVREDVKPLTDDNPEKVNNLHRVLLSSPSNRDAWLLRSVQGLQRLHTEGGFPRTRSGARGMRELRGAGNPVYRWWNDETEEADTKWHALTDYYRLFDLWFRSESAGNPMPKRQFTLATKEMVGGKTLTGLELRMNTTSGAWEARGRKPRRSK